MYPESTVVRHIATSFEGQLFATAEFENQVSIWELKSGKLLTTFATHLDYGGKRLTISPDDEFCAAGAYSIHGLSNYRTKDGTLVWSRKELKKVQWLKFNNTGKTLFAGFEDKPLHVLDSKTGETLETYRGVRRIYLNPYNNFHMLDATNLLLINGKSKPINIQRRSFGVLNAAFSPQFMYISEAGGPLRAIDCLQGTCLWKYLPEQGSHYIRLAYNEASGTLFCVQWSYEKAGASLLLEFDSLTGKLLGTRTLGITFETDFADRGKQIITSNKIIDSKSNDIFFYLKKLKHLLRI